MSPSKNHSRLQITLGSAFLNLAVYAVYSELSLEIEGKEYVPDLSLYPSEPFEPTNDSIRVSIPPLLIAEILSPTQNIQELIDKFKIYFSFGIQSCWLVMPVSRAITVFNTLNEPRTYGSDQVKDEKLGITLSLNKIFP